MTPAARRVGTVLCSVAALLASGCRNPNSAKARQDFVTAVQEDQIDTVRRWLADGLDPNIPPTADCSTPLALASANGNLEMAALLAQRGARLDDPAGPDGHTALGCVAALEVDAAESVAQLLDLGADADATGGDGRTPLMLAAERGHIESVKALIAARASVRLLAPDGVGAIDLASRGGHAEVVAALAAAGATPPARASGSADQPPAGVGVAAVLTELGSLVPGETYDEARAKLETGQWIDTFHQTAFRSIETRRINGTVYRFVFERDRTEPFRLVRIEAQ